MRSLVLCLIALFAGCASVDSARKCAGISREYIDDRGFKVNDCSRGPRIERPTLKDLLNLSPPRQKAVVSVYSFEDKTGQRATSDNMALFSTAVTQAGDSFLIDALLAAGKGKWFLVAERGNLDALTRELFSGLIMAGGIVGYDTNLRSGGIGARYLGIGVSSQYRIDEVTVALRAVLVQTGQVLLNVLTSKQIYSTSTGLDTFRFTENGTELFELESGFAANETQTYAVRSAIEAAVYAIVIQGIEHNLWDFELQKEVSNGIPD